MLSHSTMRNCMYLLTPPADIVSRPIRLCHHPLRSRFSGLVTATSDSVMAADTVRVAAAQMTSINDLASNFATCVRLVKEAASSGAKLLCFPENFSYVGLRQGDGLRVAQPLDGPIMQGYCRLARCPSN